MRRGPFIELKYLIVSKGNEIRFKEELKRFKKGLKRGLKELLKRGFKGWF